jgi:hypothetical protein
MGIGVGGSGGWWVGVSNKLTLHSMRIKNCVQKTKTRRLMILGNGLKQCFSLKSVAQW